MNMDSDSVVNNVLKKENALRLLEEKRREEGESEQKTEAEPPMATPAAEEPTSPPAAIPEAPDAPEAAEATPPPTESGGTDGPPAEAAGPRVASGEDRPPDGPEEDPAEVQAARARQQAQMEQMESMLTEGRSLEGRIVEGEVVQKDNDGVLVNVGAKSEGLIRAQEFARGELEDLNVGDKISVFIVRADDEEESIQLSKKKADYEISWQRILKSYEKGEIVQCAVTDRVKGGLRVDLGIMGFIPASHVGVRNPNDLDRFVGEIVNARIIEVDRNRKKVILSRRIAEKELREDRKSTILVELREGQVRDGVVRNITNYGAFVDLGGVDGLLHVTEMSWVHVRHPEEVVKPGDELQVMVLKIDRDRERISLGLKQLQPDPWDEVGRNYRVGQTLTVTVSRCVASGAFVKLPEGVEAFIPIGEMAHTHIDKPEDVIRPGQEVEAKIINLQPRQRRMSLSLIQAANARYMESASTAEPAGVTIGDRYGALLQQAVVRPEAAEEAAPEPGAEEPAEAPASEEAPAGEPEDAPASEEAPAGEPEDAPASEEAPAGEPEDAPASEEAPASEPEDAPASEEALASEPAEAPAEEQPGT